MPKYALNPQTGKVTLCRAEKKGCVHVDQQHYESKREAQSAFEESNERMFSPLSKRSQKDLPVWAVAIADRVKELGGEYRVVERFQHGGKEMIATFATMSPAENDYWVQRDSGLNVTLTEFRDEKTGEQIGFLKGSYMNRESMQRCFGPEDDYMTYIHYASRYEGSAGLPDADDPDPRGEDESMRRLWANVFNSSKVKEARISPPSGQKMGSYMWDKRDAPDGLEDIESDIKHAALSAYKQEYEDHLSSLSEPYVDYSFIDDRWQDKGLGTKLYVTAAQQLGREGMVLRSSGVQSDEAQRLWSSLKKNKDIVVHEGAKIDRRGREQKFSYLDYRNL